MENNYPQKIIDVLKSAEQPLGVEKVRAQAGIGNWNTAHKHLLQLLLEKRICGQKTSLGWIFWIEKGAS